MLIGPGTRPSYSTLHTLYCTHCKCFLQIAHIVYFTRNCNLLLCTCFSALECVSLMVGRDKKCNNYGRRCNGLITSSSAASTYIIIITFITISTNPDKSYLANVNKYDQKIQTNANNYGPLSMELDYVITSLSSALLSPWWWWMFDVINFDMHNNERSKFPPSNPRKIIPSPSRVRSKLTLPSSFDFSTDSTVFLIINHRSDKNSLRISYKMIKILESYDKGNVWTFIVKLCQHGRS